MLKFVVAALGLLAVAYYVHIETYEEAEEMLGPMTKEACRGALIMAHPRINWENPNLLKGNPKLTNALSIFERGTEDLTKRGECMDALSSFNYNLYN